MICCIVLKPVEKGQRLLLTRQRQKELVTYMEAFLSYRPFVFNTVHGVYIFVKKRESYEKINTILEGFLRPASRDKMELVDTTAIPHFFKSVLQKTLTSKENSAWAWRRFISSFLIQVDPYSQKTPLNNIAVFKKFHNCLKKHGSKQQRKFYKRRMKILRERVSLENVERILEIK